MKIHFKKTCDCDGVFAQGGRLEVRDDAADGVDRTMQFVCYCPLCKALWDEEIVELDKSISIVDDFDMRNLNDTSESMPQRRNG